MANKTDLTVIIPCFNEELRILPRFSKAYVEIKKACENFEIILVNDGSKDKTEEVLNSLAKKYRNIKVVSYKNNQGKGYALKQGVKVARGQIIGYTDADFAISLKDLPKIIKKIKNGTDIVIADRKSHSSRIENSPDKFRRFLSQLHTKINNFFLDLGPIYDTLGGLKFFKGMVAKRLFSEIKLNRWFYDLELLILARKNNYTIYQIPVSWEEVRGSKVKIVNQLYSLIKDHLFIYATFFNLKIYTVLTFLLLLLIISPFLINPQSLTLRNGDFSDLVWPDYYFIKQSILNYHQIPFWNPTLFSGIPEIANPQSPLIYPLNWPIFLMPLDLGIVLVIIFHFFIASIFLFKLAKDIFKWGSLEIVVFSYGVIFNPFFWSKVSVGHISMVLAMLLAAPVIYFAALVYKNLSKKAIFYLSLFLAAQYLNYPTIWYYTILFSFIFLVPMILIERSWRKIWNFGISFLLSLVLISPVLLIQFQAGSLITRSSLKVTDLAIPIWSLKKFFISIITPANLIKDWDSEIWLYSSIILIGLAVIGFGNLKRLVEKLIFGLVILFILLITLGNRTAFFLFLVKFLPGFSYLRVVTRDWFVLIYVLSFLAALGLSNFKGRLKRYLFIIVLMDLIFFSVLRLIVVPDVMNYRVNKDIVSLLRSDSDYRYYCTSRCLSARETLPLGIKTADGYHLLILKNYRINLSRAGGFEPPQYTGNIPSFDNFGAQPNAYELGKFSVKSVVSEYSLNDSGFKLITKSGKYFLYENKQLLARIRFENPANNNLKVLKDTPNEKVISNFGEGGRLIVADSFYPNWKGYINGSKTYINIYDGWAMSVDLGPGLNIIQLKYQPFNFLPNNFFK